MRSTIWYMAGTKQSLVRGAWVIYLVLLHAAFLLLLGAFLFDRFIPERLPGRLEIAEAPVETWSSTFAELGIVSTLAG
ncbi:MAG: hypothetical protein ABI539_02210, partial [Acidobacteriota bacterium]